MSTATKALAAAAIHKITCSESCNLEVTGGGAEDELVDLEVVFLFPWSLVLNQISETGFWSMILFLIILLIGFIYEWKKNALEWS